MTAASALLALSLPCLGDAVWNGGNGAWGNAANWTPATVPNSIGTITHFLINPNDDFFVDLSGGFTISKLDLVDEVQGGYSFGNGTLIFDSQIPVLATAATDLAGPHTLAASGTFQFNETFQLRTYFIDSTFTADGRITGGNILVKLGLGTAILNKTNNSFTGTSLQAGILAIAADGSLGTAAGAVNIFFNSTLQTRGDVNFNTARQFIIDVSGGAIDLYAHHSTINGEITGAGIFSVIDNGVGIPGTLTLTHDNSAFTGGFKVSNDTTLLVSADNQLGAANAPLAFGGGTLETTASFASNRPTHIDTNFAEFDVDAGVTTEWNGLIDGAGVLEKDKLGTLVLTNSGSTFSGGSSFTGGTVAVSVSSMQAANGSVISGPLGTSTVDIYDGVTLKSTVNGITIGNHITILGDIFLAPGGADFALVGDVDMLGGTRTVTNTTANSTVAFSGSISDGGLTFLGGAGVSRFIYNGSTANTYAGLTTVGHNAELYLKNTAAAGNGAIQGDVLIQDNGVLFLQRDEQIADTSTVTVNSAGHSAAGGFAGFELAGAHETIGRLLGNSTGTIGLGNGTLTVGAGDFSGSITNGFSNGDGQLVKVGPGTLILSGTNTYTGDTTINGGLLQVDGSIGSHNTFVGPAGTLGGTGTITGNVFNNGSVSPGHSPGTLTIHGNYSQTTTGTLRIEVAGRNAGEHDLLAVDFNATLAGTVQLVRLNGFQLVLGDHIPFLTATNGVFGTFASEKNDFATGTAVVGKVVYSAHEVALEGAQAPFTSVPKLIAEQFPDLLPEYFFLRDLTPNQRAVARNLDRAVGDRRADKLIRYLDSELLPKLPGDFDRIAPEELSAIFQIGISLATVQAQNLQRRTADIRSGANGFSAAAFAINGQTPSYSGGFGNDGGASGPTGDDGQEATGIATTPPEKRWGAFLSGTGEWVSVGDTTNARGYDLTSGGFTLGVDYRLTSQLAVGLSAGYTGTSADLANGGRISVNGGKLGLYASYFTGGFYADAAVNGGYNSYDTRRSALQGDARGSTEGGELNVLFGTGYDFKKGALTFGPTASFNYTYVGFDSFEERGSLAPLHFGGQHGESLRTLLGFKASYDWKIGSVVVKPEFRIGWQHEYGDSTYAVDSTFANGAGNVFTVQGPRLGRDSVLLGAGVAAQFNDRVSAYMYYDGELGRRNYQSTNVTGGIKVTF